MGMPGQRPMPARQVHRSRRRRRALEYHEEEEKDVHDAKDELLEDGAESRFSGYKSRHLSWSLGGDFLSSMLGSFRKVYLLFLSSLRFKLALLLLFLFKTGKLKGYLI